MKCKKCNSENTVKNGKQKGIQRHKCKNCEAVFRENEPKYSKEFKMEAVMMYLNSMGIRAIGRIKGVYNSVISTWIKKIGSIVKEKFHSEIDKVQEENIQIMEIDELFTYVKKRKTKRIYLLVSSGRIVDVQVAETRDKNEYLKLAFRLKKRYKTGYLCTDGYEVYSSYKIAEKHTTTKAETALVEAKNSSYRDSLARLNRKTKRYSKRFGYA